MVDNQRLGERSVSRRQQGRQSKRKKTEFHTAQKSHLTLEYGQ
jgi:hypothetical protein